MKVLFNKKFLKHNIDSEAEGAFRMTEFPEHFQDVDYNGEEYITLVHSEDYLKKIKEACYNNEVVAEVQLTPDSFQAAISAVGLAVKAARNRDFAVVRPPGHHAAREKASGFCFFNNIAIASQLLVNEGKRVFIFDFDGHHGDGTQSIFYNSDQVFFSSTHQLWAYPRTGFADEKGSGDGKGYTLNLPLISGNGDKEFFVALDKAIEAARVFEPDVVAVSAGFDAYVNDRLLQLNFSKKAYYECGLRLRRAFPKIFAVLEGGYHNELRQCIQAFVDGVNVGARPRKNLFDQEMSVG